MDVLVPADPREHVYESLFHLNAQNASLGTNDLRAIVDETGRPVFSISPLVRDGLEAEIVKGQEGSEILGWELFLDGDKRAIPVALYRQRGSGPQAFAYALQANPRGEPRVFPTLTEVNVGDNTFGVEVLWEGGGIPQKAVLAVSAEDNGVIEWDGGWYQTSAMIQIGEDCVRDAMADEEGDPCSFVNCESPSANWKHTDVGQVSIPGDVCQVGDLFVLEAAGKDIWDTQDAFHYLYQFATGDVEITARVTSLDNTDPWAKAGIMFRNGLSANAQNVMMLFTEAGRWSFQHRIEESAMTISNRSDAAEIMFPQWVKLKRTGNLFEGYYSSDGSSWRFADAIHVDMDTEILVGLAATSHNENRSTTAVFDRVWVEQVARSPRHLSKIFDSVRIFPNLSAGRIQVIVEDEEEGMLRLEILDTLGRTLLSETVVKDQYRGAFSLSLPDMSSGAYLLSIAKESQRQSFWFVQ